VSQAIKMPQQVCPSDPARPLVEPEGLSLMNVPAAQQIVDGAGIKVAVIAFQL
jgi:hypothetical protein